MYFLPLWSSLTRDKLPPVKYSQLRNVNRVVNIHTYLGCISTCSFNVKVSLFRAYCSNMYCSQLWAQHSRTSVNNLRVAYNNAFRIFMGLERDCSACGMFVRNTLPTFEALRRNQMYSFFSRLRSSDNQLIKAILNSDASVVSKINLTYRNLMYL